jgi:hypothetical protein
MIVKITVPAEYSDGTKVDTCVFCSRSENSPDELDIQAITIKNFSSENNGRLIKNYVLPDSYGRFKITSFKKWYSTGWIQKIDSTKFYQDLIGTYHAPIQNLYIPDSITEINAVFKDRHILNIRWPSNCTSVEARTFESCKVLTVSNFKNVTSLGLSAFADSNIKQIDSLESCTEMDYGVFANCTGLTEFNWPSKVKEIPFICFENCTSLDKINGIENVDSIGEEAFAATKIKSFIWPEKCTVIPARCFSGATELSDISIPLTVTEIKSEAFAETNLKEVDLSDFLVVKLGEDCFPKETKVTLPFYQQE